MKREDNIVIFTRIQYNSRDEVTRNARKVNRKVHFASLMGFCHLKHTEFNTHHQTYQVHVVLNETSSSLTKQGASPSRVVAATVLNCKIAGNGEDMKAMLVCRSGLWFSVARFGSARPSVAKTVSAPQHFGRLSLISPHRYSLGLPQEYVPSLSPDRQHFRCFCPYLPTQHEAFGQIWAIQGPFAKSTSRSCYSGSSNTQLRFRIRRSGRKKSWSTFFLYFVL